MEVPVERQRASDSTGAVHSGDQSSERLTVEAVAG